MVVSGSFEFEKFRGMGVDSFFPGAGFPLVASDESEMRRERQLEPGKKGG